ncbi:MAG: hypothetical protein Q9M27_06405, partial [Mariprofundaceae bacterium]|nr:hypothetical protein [Mariprofundaceae bacterium]
LLKSNKRGEIMKPRQRDAINRIIRFYRKRNHFNGATSVRVNVDVTDYGPVWITVKTRRSDCDENSPLAVMAEQYAFICIGPRSGITVHTANSGLSDEVKHVSFMLRL